VPHIEIHGHSGPELLRWHSEIWRAAGIQLCSWQAFEIWQAPDRLAGESLQALAKTTTRRGANGVLVQQTRVRTAIQQIMTLIRAGESSQAFGLLESMVAGHRVARAWTTPWRVALCGKPNAGKSSLLNALTGSTRAIVSAIPGTTRDVVRGTTAIDGWLVEFSDTAGLRESDDMLEQAGMNAGKTVAKQADLVLWLTEDIDQSGIPHATDQIVVHTKSDIRPSSLSHAHAVDVSAVSGQGIDALLQLIVDKLAGNANLLAGAVAFSSALERSCQRAILDLSHNRTEEALTEIGTWLNSGPEPVESIFP
jgi:tRNA modification GTPase